MTQVFKLLFIGLAIAQVLHGEPVSASSSQPTTVYLVRHGLTDANVRNIVAGSSDVPLNDTGREQARAAKKEFDCIPFTASYSSNLIRAKETAGILLEGRGLTATPDPRLREKGFGIWEGKSFDEFYALSDEEQKKVSESPEAVIKRVQEGLNAVVKAHPGETILVVAHGGVIKFLIAPIMGLSWTDLKVGNLAYVKLIFKDGEWSIGGTQGIEILSTANH
jgi:broad specificity phosphatase PhoE